MTVDPTAVLADITASPAVHQAPNSRYRNTPTAEWVGSDGTVIVYLRRRFIPALESLRTTGRVTVAAGDRIDTIAAEVIGDPTRFWQLADANLVTRPAELVAEPGRVLRIAGGPGA